jgi:CCR4-NOT transcriptional regulation complex NOT5 subunit
VLSPRFAFSHFCFGVCAISFLFYLSHIPFYPSLPSLPIQFQLPHSINLSLFIAPFLTAEIDRVMKKVDEGVELFDEIWEKVYSAEQQNQKEKYEMDLKKEIKKLQRLRDQIKSWIGSSDVKEKEPLVDARKLIETKMEAFKYCEKETKTKTYSKEGLMKAEKLTPEDIAKLDTTKWISEIIEKFMEVIEERDLEVEKLSAGRGKKTNKNLIDECNNFLQMHKYHLMKLEGITRLVNNDVLDVDVVDPVREDLEYYLDSYEDEDYQQAYDEDFFYEALGLDELQVVNVDHVTQAETEKLKLATAGGGGGGGSSAGCSQTGSSGKGKKGDKNNNAIDESDSRSKGSDKGKKSGKSKSASSMVPITIGRARKGGTKTLRSSSKRGFGGSDNGDSGDDDSTHGNTPTKTIRRGSTIPAVVLPNMVSNTPGSSMAAILKRETEQQEKERQAKVCICLYILLSFIYQIRKC